VALVVAALEYLVVILLVVQEHLDKAITEAVVHLLLALMVVAVAVVLRLLALLEQAQPAVTAVLELHLQLLAHL
jgi:hypothetical protein